MLDFVAEFEQQQFTYMLTHPSCTKQCTETAISSSASILRTAGQTYRRTLGLSQARTLVYTPMQEDAFDMATMTKYPSDLDGPAL